MLISSIRVSHSLRVLAALVQHIKKNNMEYDRRSSLRSVLESAPDDLYPDVRTLKLRFDALSRKVETGGGLGERGLGRESSCRTQGHGCVFKFNEDIRRKCERRALTLSRTRLPDDTAQVRKFSLKSPDKVVPLHGAFFGAQVALRQLEHEVAACSAFENSVSIVRRELVPPAWDITVRVCFKFELSPTSEGLMTHCVTHLKNLKGIRTPNEVCEHVVQAVVAQRTQRAADRRGMRDRWLLQCAV
ncbi:hypothetical protein L226DRAFT_527701 [Lentinus tigrinus ALCF2SS1-7]|uniref:Uncharacterized protein n=1 Tax=Lentinus tigrinus ALCF2SS1-6 TaxID=1328759 RepID=A0A5C2RMI9_9APHY|nr:hypothetical protein L227DRAFT_568783 [Lentinus tigrinus ALCF2SS1-6]RPD67686.1 hypothetical protein L226DRAFT_527701 [Lentinus tigrinus ALCF2SS1-7]